MRIKTTIVVPTAGIGLCGKSKISFAEIYNLYNILFFLKIHIILHFPRGFVHFFSAVRT